MPGRSLLVERHGDVRADGLALPLVAGVVVETDTHRVGPALTGLERAELDVARQAGDRGRRQVAVDARRELRRVGVALATTEVVAGHADRHAELHVRRDGPGVLDRELVVRHVARLDVRVRQLERAGVVGVGQLNRQRAGLHRHVAGVAGREVGPGGTGAVQGQPQGCGGEATDGDVADLAVLARGHGVPSL